MSPAERDPVSSPAGPRGDPEPDPLLEDEVIVLLPDDVTFEGGEDSDAEPGEAGTPATSDREISAPAAKLRPVARAPAAPQLTAPRSPRVPAAPPAPPRPDPLRRVAPPGPDAGGTEGRAPPRVVPRAARARPATSGSSSTPGARPQARRVPPPGAERRAPAATRGSSSTSRTRVPAALEPIEGDERAALPVSVRACIFTGLLWGGLLAVLFAVGWRYYLTAPVRRPFHFQHVVLRPSSATGLTLGVVGTVVILLSLLYVLRKRFVSLGSTGSLRSWLAWHILAGIAGPVCILFHSAFAPSSAAGLLAFGSMWVVVLSGFVGRYIHVHVPKTIDGRELDLEEVRGRLRVYRSRLAALGVDDSLLLREPAAPRSEWLWLFRALGGVLWGDRAARRELDELRRVLSSSVEEGGARDEAMEIARRLAKERQWLVRHREVRKLMAAWRFFHGWFVMILLAGIIFHVAIAIRFGDLRILGGGR